MRKPLKSTVRDRFEDIELSEAQLNDLAARMQLKEPVVATRKPMWRQATAIAAAMIIVAIGSVLGTQV